ncbi:hypothetical protein KP509_33G045100 [Ceratopteris richardii]|nr:hypothetical protein KP509_33G045100 [Ceratopteris richardii]
MRFSNKIIRSTGKAAWIAGTTFIILAVPLYVERKLDERIAMCKHNQHSLLEGPSQPFAFAFVE